ncbi:MAG: hypothetical protein ACRERE_22850 [Candidatus Entotheonellia bacterium]
MVFQDMRCGNGLKNPIERNALFHHLLLGMLGDTNILPRSLGTYPLQCGF